jgi:hypothetical protein
VDDEPDASDNVGANTPSAEIMRKLKHRSFEGVECEILIAGAEPGILSMLVFGVVVVKGSAEGLCGPLPQALSIISSWPDTALKYNDGRSCA